MLVDSNEDSPPLHTHAATHYGAQLVHPLRGQVRAGGERRTAGGEAAADAGVASRARHAWDAHPALARLVMKARDEIERVFGRLRCAAGGPAAWVRRLARVRRWVSAKITVYNARLEVRERVRAGAVA